MRCDGRGFYNSSFLKHVVIDRYFNEQVWIVGEFAHTGYDVRCTADKLSLFYETLEMIGYEISYNLGQYSGYTLRLIMVLMNTLAKLASRCQDLIPRTLLCLNKIVNQSIVSCDLYCSSLFGCVAKCTTTNR
jgi:AP-5 complex subunit zeta-1